LSHDGTLFESFQAQQSTPPFAKPSRKKRYHPAARAKRQQNYYRRPLVQGVERDVALIRDIGKQGP